MGKYRVGKDGKLRVLVVFKDSKTSPLSTTAGSTLSTGQKRYRWLVPKKRTASLPSFVVMLCSECGNYRSVDMEECSKCCDSSNNRRDAKKEPRKNNRADTKQSCQEEADTEVEEVDTEEVDTEVVEEEVVEEAEEVVDEEGEDMATADTGEEEEEAVGVGAVAVGEEVGVAVGVTRTTGPITRSRTTSTRR